jgi:hypothetical protein
MLHVHGLGDRRHGHDGSENLRRPHVVQMMPTKSILSNFKAMKHRVEGSGIRACFGRRENPRGIEGIVQLGWVSTRRDGAVEREATRHVDYASKVLQTLLRPIKRATGGRVRGRRGVNSRQR